jgi:hypothetical protein
MAAAHSTAAVASRLRLLRLLLVGWLLLLLLLPCLLLQHLLPLLLLRLLLTMWQPCRLLPGADEAVTGWVSPRLHAFL